ncbi:glycine zipper 2TM domain-containing protein [Rhodoferax sp. TBRC 17660]|uniref:Glycine zipper 2TM domain-containing protein n=1 Tax=Rhodoferax potami TaxID=3068338 RepID=A0ABU3KI26_9BURK|nr:glycine zipper 2TM domain-containing protein [Rhodoferax sp. TBRC 17660]MDT7517421.1 glycine zipper 2TM domain-containing protein [Rhodoferax sp. TBRC 17660]
MNTYPTTLQQPSASRLHPVIAIAAGSVIVVSLLGAAALTGLLPNSSATAPAGLTASTPANVSAPTAKAPAPKVVSQKPATPKTSAQVASNSTPPAQAAATPAAPAEKNSAVGIGIGAVVGGLVGNQFGSGDGKTLATIAGAVGGGYVGNEIAKKNAAP